MTVLWIVLAVVAFLLAVFVLAYVVGSFLRRCGEDPRPGYLHGCSQCDQDWLSRERLP